MPRAPGMPSAGGVEFRPPLLQNREVGGGGGYQTFQ
jgi:hypothetical protein